MALDYGLKRCGIAVTDPERIIARPLSTIETPKLFNFLGEYFAEEQVDVLVIGEPKRWSGEASDLETVIQKKLLPKLKTDFPLLQIDREDEMFTSKMAAQTLYASGLGKKKRKDKGLLDSTSAALILQLYLGHI